MILKNKIMLVCIIGAAMIILMTTDTDYSFLIGYMIMLCTMFVITTISYDDYNNTISYLMTLPVTRKAYVGEKYLLMFLCAAAGLILGGGSVALWSRRLDGQFLAETGIIFVVLIIFQLIMLPLQLKFGGETSRIVLFIMFALFSGFIIAVKKIAEYIAVERTDAVRFINNVVAWISVQSVWTLAALIVAFLILCTVVSVSVSTRIMSRKEF